MTVLLIDTPAPFVRRLRINRPEARNAIDADVRAAMGRAIAEARDDDAVATLMIGGTQGIFTAGGDLPSMIGLSAADADLRMAEIRTIVAALWHFPKPVVTVVERFAVGAGAGLAMIADHVVAGVDAKIGFPFIRLGLVPDWGLLTTLPLRIGQPAAARLFREAAMVPGSQATEMGLIDEAVPAEDVERIAIERATQLAALPLAVFARMKAQLRLIDIEPALQAECAAQVACLGGNEFAEGYAAFRDKRPPDFRTGSKA